MLFATVRRVERPDLPSKTISWMLLNLSSATDRVLLCLLILIRSWITCGTSAMSQRQDQRRGLSDHGLEPSIISCGPSCRFKSANISKGPIYEGEKVGFFLVGRWTAV